MESEGVELARGFEVYAVLFIHEHAVSYRPMVIRATADRFPIS